MDVAALLAAADRFGAIWVALDANRPAPLDAIYATPDTDVRLELAATLDHTYLLEIVER